LSPNEKINAIYIIIALKKSLIRLMLEAKKKIIIKMKNLNVIGDSIHPFATPTMKYLLQLMIRQWKIQLVSFLFQE